MSQIFTRLRRWARTKTGRIIVHDVVVAAGAGVAVFEASGQQITAAVASAAGVAFLRALAHLVAPELPALITGDAGGITQLEPSTGHVLHPVASITAQRRLHLLPAPSERPSLGRRPKPDDPRDLAAARYLSRRFRHPASVHWQRAVPGFGMLLNDRIGDCGEAGWLHGLQVWLANVGHLFAPTDAQALTLYEAVAGYDPHDPTTDRGTVLRELLGYVRRHRVAGGHRALAYVSVDPHNHDEVKRAIALFGWLYVGVSLTQDAYRSQGVHWHNSRGPGGAPDPNLGHCVIYTGYDARRIDMVTWGQHGTLTWSFHSKACDEAWAVVSPDWLKANGVSPSHVNLARLETDLAAL